jgi:flagella basal body P-ring formation protein FlgA
MINTSFALKSRNLFVSFLVLGFFIEASFSREIPTQRISLSDSPLLVTIRNSYPEARFIWKDEPSIQSNERLETVYEVRPGIARATILTPVGLGLAEPNQAPRFETRVEHWGFRAMKATWIAKRRIRPSEALKREDFLMEEVDLTEPLIHEVRGLIISGKTELEPFESRVTILEGQFPITSGVQKIPAVKRGDLIKLLVKSGELELSVPGIVQEPSQIGGTLRVLTSSTKREMTGVLRDGKIVEVNL